MNVDISSLANTVQRLDRSATLKSFGAVLAPLLVLWNGTRVSDAATRLLEANKHFEEDPFALDPALALASALTVLLAVIATVLPLLFVVTDWCARRPFAPILSAITAALLGAVGFALVGTLAAIVLQAHSDTAKAAVVGFCVAMMVLTGVWAFTRSGPLARTGITLAAATTLVITGVFALWMNPISLQTLFRLAIGALVAWWLARAVQLRLVLASQWPRHLLLCRLQPNRFWIRMAYLAGIPSSLWSRRALGQLPFWLLLVARPLVYLGIAGFFSGVRHAAGGIGSAMIGGAMIVAGHLSFHLGKRLAAREIWRPENEADSRPPILFLRSFDDDQVDFKKSAVNLLGRWFDLWSFRRNVDEILIDELAQYGPVVALGKPGEASAPFGAIRHYAAHDTWQSVVANTARRAQAIIIAAGDSPGVRWEFALLAQENLATRTILLFRPGAAEWPVNRNAAAALLRGAGIVDLPPVKPDAAMIALMLHDGVPVLLDADKTTAAAYVIALRAHMHTVSGAIAQEPRAASIDATADTTPAAAAGTGMPQR